MGEGFCTVGDVTFESAAYVSRYITKKVTGVDADDHYMGRVPEFTNMSNGIGASWIAKYGKQTFTHDNIIIDGRKCKVPRFYDQRYELIDTKRLAVVKRARVRKALLRNRGVDSVDLSRQSYAKERIMRSRDGTFRRDENGD